MNRVLLICVALLLGANLKSQQLVKNPTFEGLFLEGDITPPVMDGRGNIEGTMAYGVVMPYLFDSLNKGTNIYLRPREMYSHNYYDDYPRQFTTADGSYYPTFYLHLIIGKRVYFSSRHSHSPSREEGIWQEVYFALKAPLRKNHNYVASIFFVEDQDSIQYFAVGSSMRKDSIQNESGKIYFNAYRSMKRKRSAMLFRALSDDTLLALSNKTPPHLLGRAIYTITFDNVQLFPAQVISTGYAALCGSQKITLSTSRAADHYLWNKYAPIDTNRSIQVSDTGWYVGIAFTADSAFVDSIYVGRGSLAKTHQSKYCTLPITLQTSFAGMPGYNWSTGQTTDRISVNQPGTYWCGFELSSGCSLSDTFIVSAHDIPEITLPSDTAFCRGTTISVDATHAAYKQYEWSSGANTALMNISQAGTYKLIATTHHDCLYEKTIKATVWELPMVNLPADTAFCPGDRQQLQLDAGIWKNYAWHPTGQTSQSLIIKDAGRYKVTITDSNNCKGSDEIIIREECPEEVYIPNAFTPDANGTNDWFEPKGRYIQSYLIQITNRWGEQVFNGSHAWDGKTQNQPAEPGVYAYEITVVMENKERRYSGTLTLLR